MEISSYIIPFVIGSILLIAAFKRVNSYNLFIDGAKEGLDLFKSLYPSLLSMLLAINLLKVSGILTYISKIISDIFSFIPNEVVPMILFRPISGSASLSVLVDIYKECGVDSLQGVMASVIQGSTDTTLYVITLYFGSVGIKKIKNALKIGLAADFVGIMMAILLTIAFFS